MSHRLTLTIHLLDDNTIRSLMESGGDPISFDQIGAMAASGHNALAHMLLKVHGVSDHVTLDERISYQPAEQN